MGKISRRFFRSARNTLRSVWRAIRSVSQRQVALGLIGLAAGAGVAAGALAVRNAVNQPYMLTVFANTMMGPAPVAQLMVSRTSHKSDGALCFTEVEDGSRGCIKADSYHLKPVAPSEE